VAINKSPIIDGTRAASLAQYADPLPQALVLTAIVISFAMTALLLVIALRARAEAGSDHVDCDAAISPPADSGEGAR
jgi:multicomponent K+:H+ antiporter subunit C